MIMTLNQMELHGREGKRKTGSSMPFSPGSFGPWEPEVSLSRVGGGAPSGGFSVNLWAVFLSLHLPSDLAFPCSPSQPGTVGGLCASESSG